MVEEDLEQGADFKQPVRPHEHWHVDVRYLNIRGTFFYLLSVLDGLWSAIVQHEIRASMSHGDEQIVLERARERFPETRPRIILDNRPPFIAREFKAYVREQGMDHVKTYFAETNGKIERYHRTLKTECILPKTPLGLEEASRLVAEFVAYYNEVLLHGAIGYVTPMDRLYGPDRAYFKARD